MGPPRSTARRPIDEPEFRAAVEHFQANRKKIAKKYGKKWVAILDGKVIDSDDDLGELSSRVRRSFPDRHPYMPYANPLSLEEMAQRFKFAGEQDWKRVREEAETEAADELIRRMFENMKYNMNG